MSERRDRERMDRERMERERMERERMERERMERDATTGQTRGRQARDAEDVAIPVAEERLSVEKREAELGAVEVRKTVETEQVSVPVELEREEVRVEEVDVADRPLRPGEDAFREGTIRVPVRGEEAVVSKEAVVTGEVVVDKERVTERQQVSDTVRKERVAVDEHVRQGVSRGAARQETTRGETRRQTPPAARAERMETTTAASSGTAGRARGADRTQVQVDAEVYGADEERIGRVKEVGADDFLVDRRLQRDIYVPFDAVRSASGGRVILSLPAHEVDNQGWPNP